MVKKQHPGEDGNDHDKSGVTGTQTNSRFGIPNWPLFINIALVFFLAASAGLMVLSQSVGILLSYGAANQLAVGATSFITGMIAAARLSGGWMVDKFTLTQVMTGAHAWSLTGAIILSVWPSPFTAVIGLMMVGMGYGFISGSSAGGVAMYWRKQQFGLVSSRIYIGWCIAALSLPVLAGLLFDWHNTYQYSIWIAAIANVVGIYLTKHGVRFIPDKKMSS
jgi:MFS family permease